MRSKNKRKPHQHLSASQQVPGVVDGTTTTAASGRGKTGDGCSETTGVVRAASENEFGGEDVVGSSRTSSASVGSFPRLLGVEFDPAVWTCGILAVLLYVNTLDAGFVYDDSRAIENNPDIRPSTPWTNLLKDDFWGTPLSHSGSHKSYRPLCVASFRLNYLAGGLGPFGYHLVNVLAHGLATALFVSLCREVMSGRPLATWASGLTFAAHPVHVEAVAGVVGRADVFACVLFLLSFRAYRRHADARRAAAAAVAAAGTTRAGSAVGGDEAVPDCADVGLDPRSACWRRSLTPEAGPSSFCGDDDGDGNWSSSSSTASSFSSCSSTSSASSSSSSSSTSATYLLRNRTQRRTHQGPPADDETGTSCSRGSGRSKGIHLGLSVCYAGLAMLCKEHGITVLGVCLAYEILVVSRLRPADIVNLVLPFSGKSKTGFTSSGIRTAPRSPHHELQHQYQRTPSREGIGSKRQRSGISGDGSRFGRVERSLESVSVLLTACAALLALRLYATGPAAPEFAAADNPASQSDSALTRALTFLFLPAFNFWLLLCPTRLSFDWSMDAVPLVESVWDVRVGVSLVFYACLGALFLVHNRRLIDVAWLSKICSVFVMDDSDSTADGGRRRDAGRRRQHPWHWRSYLQLSEADADSDRRLRRQPSSSSSRGDQVTTALLLLVVPFLPATNLFFHVGFVVAERVLYVPSMGFAMLVGLGFDVLWSSCGGGRNRRAGGGRRWRRVVIWGLFLTLVALCARTLVRNRDWVDEHALYTSGIPVNPAKSYGNLGRVLSATGRQEEAEAAYRNAIRLRPNMADAYYNLGVLLQNQGRTEEAAECYKTAIRCRPKLATAYLNLGQLYASRGETDRAVEVWKKCAQLDSEGLKDPRAHEVATTAAVFHLGRLYADAGRYFEAIESYETAIRRRPDSYQPQSIYNMLGEAHTKLGHYEEAERWYKAALEAKPDHVPAHLKYGRMLAKNRSRLMEAELHFLRAKRLAPEDTSVYFHFGQFLLESSRYDEAAVEYERAAELAPGDVDAVLNAANALRQAGYNDRAENFYRRAVQLQPDDPASHMNLGAMLHLNGKLLEAEQSYLKSLELRPHDATTLTNLERLYNLFNKHGIKRRHER